MSGELLADTNVVSYLYRNGPHGAGYDALIAGRELRIALLSLEELHYGVARQRWSTERIHQFDVFLRRFSVLPTPTAIAEISGGLRAERARVGRPISLPDAWIAATALWYDLPVVTHDRDLEAIPGLRVLTLHDEWCVRDSVVPATYGRARTEAASESTH